MNRLQRLITICTYILYAAIVTILAVFIVYNANWVIGDQWQNIRTTGLGLPMHSSDFCFPNNGRCWPWALLHYNILLLFQATSPQAHYILNCILFIVFAGIVLVMFHKAIPVSTKKSTAIHISACLAACYMLFREHYVFLDLIYGETTLALLLSAFVLCTILFFCSNKLIWGIVALVCAIYATYCKEPTFASLVVIAATLLLFNYKQLTKIQKIFSFALIINGLVFLFVYLAFYHRAGGYCPSYEGKTPIDIFFIYLMQKKILLVGFPLALWRLVRIVFYKEREHLLFDAILFGGLTYALELCTLRLLTNYYILPALLLVTPAVFYFSVYYLTKLRLKNIPLMSFGFLFAVFYGFKAYKHILVVQDDFKNDHAVIEMLKSNIDNGYDIFYYQADSTNYNWCRTLIEYRYIGYSGLMAYYEKDADYQIPIITCMEDYLEQPTLILYPIENDYNYPLDKVFGYQEEFKTNMCVRDSLITTYHWDSLTERKGVTIYRYH